MAEECTVKFGVGGDQDQIHNPTIIRSYAVRMLGTRRQLSRSGDLVVSILDLEDSWPIRKLENVTLLLRPRWQPLHLGSVPSNAYRAKQPLKELLQIP